MTVSSKKNQTSPSSSPEILLPSVHMSRNKKSFLWLTVGLCFGAIVTMWLVFFLPTAVARPMDQETSLLRTMTGMMRDTVRHFFPSSATNDTNTAPSAQEQQIHNIESSLFPDIQL